MRAISRSKPLGSISPPHYTTQPWTVRCNGWQEDKGPPLVTACWRSGCSARIIQEGTALSQAKHSLPIAINLQEKQRAINELLIQADISRACGNVPISNFPPSHKQSLPVPNVSAHLSMVTHIKSERGIWFPQVFRKLPTKCHLLSHSTKQWLNVWFVLWGTEISMMWFTWPWWKKVSCFLVYVVSTCWQQSWIPLTISICGHREWLFISWFAFFFFPVPKF